MQLNASPFYTVKMASSGKKRAAHETDESGDDSVSDIGFNARGEIYCFGTKIYKCWCYDDIHMMQIFWHAI